jgi:acetyl esterase/lipase
MSSLQHSLIKRALSSLFGGIRDNGFSIPELRKSLDMHSMVFFLPWGVETETMRLGNVAAEWIIPREADHDKVLLYLHGGGYQVGSIKTHRALVGAIAKSSGVCALIPEYRLAPEHPFPAALEDSLAAYKYLLETGHDPSDIVVGGDSAGGGLAVSLLLEIRDQNLPMPASAILLSPWVDLTVSQPSVLKLIDQSPTLFLREMRIWAKNYAGDFPLELPKISPMYADLKGLPSMLIQTSDADALIDENQMLAANARRDGVEVDLQVWPGMFHVWQVFWRELSQGQEAIDKLGAFVRKSSPGPLRDIRSEMAG